MFPNPPVVFIDSGVGGLPYCRSFLDLAGDTSVAYVADRVHFPYGPKSRADLEALLIDLVSLLRARFDPRLIVIACNTASVTALEGLRSAFPDLPFVGTVPAVKPAALASRKRRVGVLATERTVHSPYVALLAERFAPDCVLECVAAPELVTFVERDFAASSAEERRAIAAEYVRRFRELDVDSVVLGCTHFLFLADEFVEAGGNDIRIFDSRAGVSKRAAELAAVDCGAGSVGAEARRSEGGRNEHGARAARLFVTGAAPLEPSWTSFAALFGLSPAGPLDGGRGVEA